MLTSDLTLKIGDYGDSRTMFKVRHCLPSYTTSPTYQPPTPSPLYLTFTAQSSHHPPHSPYFFIYTLILPHLTLALL